MSRYYDADNNIKTDLLDTQAEKTAQSFVVKNPHNPRRLNQRKSLSSAQLRKFFGEFRQLEKRIQAKDFDSVKPLIKMIKSKASYASNPANPKIPESFKKFLVENVNAIETEKDFKAFILHFEAVVGFFYGIPGVSNN